MALISTGTGADKLATGTTIQRPAATPADAGLIRFNSETLQLEQWDGSTWGSIGGGVEVSPTPPTPANPGDLWYDSSVGRLYVYYTDADSSQWVDASPDGSPSEGGANVSIGDTPPTSPAPVDGDLWWNSKEGQLFVYYSDGNSSQWVDASPNSAGVTNIKILDDISSGFDGVTTTFQMVEGGGAVVASNAQQCLIQLGAVMQRPGIDYSVNGASITFTTPPQNSGLTFFGRVLGSAYTLASGADLGACSATTANGVFCWNSALLPGQDGQYDVGSSSAKAKDGYFSGTMDVDGDSNVGGELAVTAGGTFGSDVSVNGDATMTSQNSGQLAGFRNHLINGSVLVDQRKTETTPVDLSGATYAYGPDRWAIRGSAGTEYDFKQVTDGPNSEFPYSARARAKGSSTSTATVVQMIELNKVGVSAPFSLNSTYIFSAWVKTTDATSISAIVRFTNTIMATGGSDSCTVSPASVSVTAGTWTKVEFQVTTPAAITVTTAAALYVGIKTADVTTASYTGLQFEPGPVATPFEQRPIGTELSLCQRYFFKAPNSYGNWNGRVAGVGYEMTGASQLPVSMRISPTISNIVSAANSGFGTFVAGLTSPNSVGITATSTAIGDVNYFWFGYDADAEL